MREENIRSRIDALLKGGSGVGDRHVRSHELFNGTLSLITALYGPNSPQVQSYIKEAETLRSRFSATGLADFISFLAMGTLQNLKAEIDSGLVGSLQRTIAGDVLTDFLQLARAALNEKGDDAKNIAAVLSAAVFEDTIRRLATDNGIPHIERLQDVIIELKNKSILQGPQVGIATSYLKFRNDSLHAQWEDIGRESIVSVLGFVEQLLIKNFS